LSIGALLRDEQTGAGRSGGRKKGEGTT